jgi:hypothetical protein
MLVAKRTARGIVAAILHPGGTWRWALLRGHNQLVRKVDEARRRPSVLAGQALAPLISNRSPGPLGPIALGLVGNLDESWADNNFIFNQNIDITYVFPGYTLTVHHGLYCGRTWGQPSGRERTDIAAPERPQPAVDAADHTGGLDIGDQELQPADLLAAVERAVAAEAFRRAQLDPLQCSGLVENPPEIRSPIGCDRPSASKSFATAYLTRSRR